jgi:hypothetical protein
LRFWVLFWPLITVTYLVSIRKGPEFLLTLDGGGWVGVKRDVMLTLDQPPPPAPPTKGGVSGWELSNQPRTHRAMITFMMSLVPAEGPKTEASRRNRLTAYSSMQP